MNFCEVAGNWFSLHKNTGPPFSLAIEAGKTYYLRLNSADLRMHLELADEAEGYFLIGSSAYATSQPTKK